jgi:hypothetical protein
MASISQFQSVFRTGQLCLAFLAGTGSQYITRACQFLIAHSPRRLKCDRQVPCSTCASNGIGQSCHYATRLSNGIDRQDEGFKNSEAHLRLQRLEEMVKSLMQKTGDGLENPTSNKSNSNENMEQSIGSLSVDRSPHRIIRTTVGHMDYQGGTHWSAILENVGSFP